MSFFEKAQLGQVPWLKRTEAERERLVGERLAKLRALGSSGVKKVVEEKRDVEADGESD